MEVRVFIEEDFLDDTLSAYGLALRANDLLSARLVKRFGQADGNFTKEQIPGDTHFILSTEMYPIVKEPVKKEITREDLERIYQKASFRKGMGPMKGRELLEFAIKELGL